MAVSQRLTMTSNSDPAITGDVGENEVQSMLLRLGWNVWSTNNRDRGTDLIALTRDVDQPVAFGVQVKSGERPFRSKEHDDNGDVSGWWLADTSSHFDYWSNHALPHILVLYDDGKKTGYWVHVTADKVRSTGKRRKILVPANQTIDETDREALLTVAYSQRHTPMLEGTAFWAAAENIAPEHQLRYALLAPRLVAPHPNTGHDNPINAVEAVALVAQGRFRDLAAFAEQHPTVPDPAGEPPEGSDWAWSLVAAMWNWATTDSVDGLIAAFDSAPGGKEKGASGVLLACALKRLHVHGGGMKPHTGHAEATAVLDELVERSDVELADLGWVLVQRARCHTDASRDEDAQADARAALETLTDGTDVTATALAAAATATVWSIVAAEDFEKADLGGLMTASDNAVSWWRSQAISGALTSAARTHFNAWAEKRFLLLAGGNATDNSLFAAELNADLLGDHGTYRHIASLKARQRMMSAASFGDEVSELTEGLDSLRRSGDESSLESAIKHLRRVGPVEAVANSVNKISTEGWTRTTAAANFSALRWAGDLLEESTATDLLLWIARSVGGDGTEYDKRVLETVLVDPWVLGAAEGLMHSTDSSAHQAVAKMVGAWPGPKLDHQASRLPDIIGELNFDRVAVPERNALSELAKSDQGRFGAAVLGWLAANNESAALTELKLRAASGNLAALGGIPAKELDAAEAQPIVERLATVVKEALSAPSLVDADGSGALTWLNLRFPDVALWDPVIELLCEPLVLERDKRASCLCIIEAQELLPSGPKERLALNVDSIGVSVSALGTSSVSSVGVATSIALGVISRDDADTAITRLASGSRQERQDATVLLGSGHCAEMQPVLAGLAGDPDFEVRLGVAKAVGKLAAAQPSPQISELAQRIASHRGTDLSEMLLIGLAQHDQALSGIGVEMAQRLAESPSARVRRSAQRLLARHSSQ